VLAVRQAIVSGLRRIGATRPLLPATALVTRSLCVKESVAFTAREALRRQGLFHYTLRESGLRAALRHRTGDVVTLGEVWRNRDYDPPAQVVAALGTPARILDLGGNIGLFALHALALWPTASVVSYEPDPFNAAVLRRSQELNGMDGRWRLVPAAAGAAPGSVRFAAGQDALSHVVDDGEPGATIDVRVDDVLSELAAADLAKIDIEGGEWEILGDPRFASAPPRVLVLEYHPRGCPSGDPHAAVRDALSAAGLSHAEIWARDDGYGMLWAWRG
jgi:FkbM family methyltransferase